jgi:DNA-directed RNA polymerase beta subunit
MKKTRKKQDNIKCNYSKLIENITEISDKKLDNFEVNDINELNEKIIKTLEDETSENKHNFLSEELLCPNTNHSDTMRINMFTNHLAQSLIIDKTEIPYVFTRFENQVGKYSSTYKQANSELYVIDRIIKNKFNSVLIVYNVKEQMYDIIEEKYVVNITENYGYKNINYLNYKAGDVIPEGTVLYHSTAYDKHLNFSFGVNLKTIYLAYKTLNYEDAIIISKSAAEKLSANFADLIEISLNPNDILLNIYGTPNYYKTFPDIGEEVINNKLLAIRRFQYDSMLVDLKNVNLQEINPVQDTIINTEGIVADIEIYSNQKVEELEKDKYNEQLSQLLRHQNNFYENLYSKLKSIAEQPDVKLSDDFNYLMARCLGFLEKQKWTRQKSEFLGVVLRFYVINKKKVCIGDKISNRYGGKGVVSYIEDDDKMPKISSEDGRKQEIVDVILSPFGVIARTNISQLIEQHLNFYSRNILNMIENYYYLQDIENMYYLYFTYLSIVSKKQYEFMKRKYDELETNEEKLKFFYDLIYDENGNKLTCLYIHQPPFFGNVRLKDLLALLIGFPEIKPYQFEGILNPLIMGEVYFIRLKHYAKSKFSARSAGTLNLKDIPSKSSTYKTSTARYSETPIRFGEMETMNMMTLVNSFALENINILTRFQKMYSSSPAERENLIKKLLTSDDILAVKKIPIKYDDPDNIQLIIKEYLACLGLKIEEE